jgi:hypothetical protein
MLSATVWGPNWEAGHAPQQEASPSPCSDQHFWSTLHTPTPIPPPPSASPSRPFMPPRWNVGGLWARYLGQAKLARRDLRRGGLQGASSPLSRLAASVGSGFLPPRPSWWVGVRPSLFPPDGSPVHLPTSSAHASRLHVPPCPFPFPAVFPFSIKRPCLLSPRARCPPFLPWHETCNRLWPPAARAPSSSTEQPLLTPYPATV